MIGLFLFALLVGLAAGLFFARKKSMKVRISIGLAIGVLIAAAGIAAISAIGEKPVGPTTTYTK